MAAFNKIQDFVEQLGLAKHDLNTHTLNVMLSNVLPLATNTVKANITEIAAGNGYTAGGGDTQNTWAEAAGVATLTGTMVVWTATGAIGPFQYVILFNDTQTVPAKPLVGWWDYGVPVTLANGETFSVKFNNSPTTGSILTLQ